MFSPDGHWLAYISNESGVCQIYVQEFPQKTSKRQISTGGGTFPVWSRHGNELYFVTLGSNRQVMAASYRVRDNSFLPDAPRVYSKNIAVFGSTRSYDPARDGKHIVALTAADGAKRSRDRVIFLLNFFDELRRRVAIGAN